jgi:hypothetical protein
MAAADPENMTVSYTYLSSVKHNSFVVASLTGVTTYFNNSPCKTREICIKPFFHSWPRFTTVIGKVVGADVLHFRSWQGGVSFGTGSTNSCGARVFPGKGNQIRAPINGGILPAREESA